MKNIFFQVKKKVKENPAAFIGIIMFFLIMLIYLKNIKPERYGDGGEYMLQTVAFKNHLSFGVTDDDLETAKIYFPEYADFLDLVMHSEPPMFKYKNAYYSCHYGAYSALVVPVLCLMRLLHINALRAFSFTNLILWFIAVLVIFFFLDTTKTKKNIISALVLLNLSVLY